MKTLWFKSEFVADILCGKKCDTIRTQSTRLPKVGDVVAFSVGPRPLFAQAIIERIEAVTIAELPLERSQQLSRCELETAKPMVRLTFSL